MADRWEDRKSGKRFHICLFHRVICKVWGGIGKDQEKVETNERVVGEGLKALAGPSFISAEKAHTTCSAHYLQPPSVFPPRTIPGHTCLFAQIPSHKFHRGARAHTHRHTPSKSSISMKFEYTPSLLGRVGQNGRCQIHRSAAVHFISTVEGGEGGGTKSQH